MVGPCDRLDVGEEKLVWSEKCLLGVNIPEGTTFRLCLLPSESPFVFQMARSIVSSGTKDFSNEKIVCEASF